MRNGLREVTGDLLIDVVSLLTELNSTLGLQGWLIVLTLAVSGMSYRSQKRGGIREAIEQLAPRYVEYRCLTESGRKHTREVQVRAGLNSFSILKGQSKVAFISNRIANRSDRVVGHSVPPYYLTISEKQTGRIQTLEERIAEHELIESVSREKSQLVVKCSTTNPVECRQVANHVLNEHDHSERNPMHREDFRPWPDP